MASVLRIIDANANRAREALRVMEEAARFLLDDTALTEAIKMLRHDLAAALAPVAGLEASRDTPGDVGTTIKAPTEMHRESAADVATAAGKRLSEALRAIEEYAKTLPDNQAALAARAEALRYRGYDLEQRLGRAMGSGHSRQWRLCVLLTAALCPGGDWLRVARGAIEGGADCLQMREKSLDDTQLLFRARELVELCRPRGVSVVINDRPDVALLSGADGVHLGQTDLPCAAVRRLCGRQLLVGVSTSGLGQARQALMDGADYCGVGPMFASSTKQKDVIVGPAYMREYSGWGRLPHVAIGGITANNVREVVSGGAQGVGVSSAVCAAPDPETAVRQILSELPAQAL